MGHKCIWTAESNQMKRKTHKIWWHKCRWIRRQGPNCNHHPPKRNHNDRCSNMHIVYNFKEEECKTFWRQEQLNPENQQAFLFFIFCCKEQFLRRCRIMDGHFFNQECWIIDQLFWLLVRITGGGGGLS